MIPRMIKTRMQVIHGLIMSSTNKAFQNIWAWKPSGHVTNILISSYLKVYIQNLVKKAKWFLLLALKFDLYVKYVKVNPWALFIHTMVCLM